MYRYFQHIDGNHLVMIPDDTKKHKKEIEAYRENNDYMEVFELVD